MWLWFCDLIWASSRQRHISNEAKHFRCDSSEEKPSFAGRRRIWKDRWTVLLTLIYTHFSSSRDMTSTTSTPPKKNHLISVAKNLLRVLSHQQVSLKDPMMDGSEQQKRAKRLTLQSVSSKKALRACPRPHWCDVKWLNAQKTDNRSCDTCGRKRPGPPTLTGW